MLLPFFLAVLAAVSTAECQEVTETVIRCTTSYGMFAARTGVNIETAFFTTTTTNSFAITSTVQATITVTPLATTFINVVNVTSTLTTTVTSVPAATTISAPVGFFPLINRGTPTPIPTAIGRHRRALIEPRAEHLQKVKRLPKTPAENTGEFIVLPNGDAQSLNRVFPTFVECRVSININSTETTIVTGLPKTEVLVPATATAVSTSTVSVTETIIDVQAQPTEYAACQPNNVVNNVLGFDNQPIYFDRIVFNSPEGFSIANSLVVNTTSAINCCIACQNMAFCAGSFYTPSIRACHLQLAQAAPSVPSLPASSSIPPFPLPSSNTSLPYPTASGAPYPTGNDTAALFPTATGLIPSGFSTLVPSATPISSSSKGGMSTLPISEPASTGTFDAPGAGTCSAGSKSLYLGMIRGQSGFPEDVAISFSNGPCGRMSVDFEEVAPMTTSELVAKRMVKIGW
ncbi:hypothetical protein BU25DRAFT_493927 [Macroventuria anomochaeta]|uniref:Uncharacterized protein n=1 Tax=Macroventuria anomochaeta TaxID=301207 RepID=A0ACB6RRK0_9PLEO|nr:uncharacterized protein BU25DRAFT_493927 [Macroventuria anomochaeta]KAF2624025.1 hypothetical protein BU25DRAFT_493927 [Macroventuria anomochaeta]